jgi:putative membrane protein
MMHYSDYGIGLGGHMGFGIFFQLIIFLGFLAIIYWVITSGNIGKSKNPEEILKTRLAKGEITKKEYHELKKELEK